MVTDAPGIVWYGVIGGMVQSWGSFPRPPQIKYFIQMPRLADLLPVSVNNSSDMGAEWLVNFAYLLGMDLCKAQAVYEKYGKGYIYAKSGFAMPDTPYQRRKMVANFGDCVIVETGGEVWVRTKRNIGALNRKRAAIADKVERRRIRKSEEELREAKRVNRLFKDGQTNPSPKRGGKGNSHAEIGKYVNFRGIRMEMTERRSEIKFATITVHI